MNQKVKMSRKSDRSFSSTDRQTRHLSGRRNWRSKTLLMFFWFAACTFECSDSIRATEGRTSSTVTSHPISVIATDVYVNRTKLNMRLSMFAEDLYLFHPIEPNEFDRLSPSDLEWALDQHKDFLLERVIVRDESGEPIQGRVVSMEPFEIPIDGVEVGRLMEYPMIYQLEFSFDEPPEFLTFSQQIIDENFVFPSEMQLSIKQSGIDEYTTEVLRPGDPFTRRFDWSIPSLSSDDDVQAWEDWYNRQREETLGITSYGSIYSFLYLNRYEVRLEVLIPLGMLSTLFDIEREDENFLSIPEQDALVPAIETFLGSHNSLRIDEIEVQPVFDRVDFYGLDLRDFAIQAERKPISMASGRVGIIMSYPVVSPPDMVALTWDLFGPNIPSVETVVFAEDGLDRAKFSRFKDEVENTFVWQPNYSGRPVTFTELEAEIPERPTRSIPVLSILMVAGMLPVVLVLGRKPERLNLTLGGVGLMLLVAGASWPFVRVTFEDPLWTPPPLEKNYQTGVFSRLHTNTYRAFEYPEERQVYDALANSIDGELLRELYLNVKSGMVIQSQGGAVARIKGVDVTFADVVEDAGMTEWPGYRISCQWAVSGTVEHWGHIHERINTYDGEFTVELVDDHWKITEMIVKDEEVRNRTGLRKF